MHSNNKIASTVAFALLGAVILWLLASADYNNFSPQTTMFYVLAYLGAIYCGASWAYRYTRGSSAVVQACTIIGGAIAASALSWALMYLGLPAWIANGPSWHAALIASVSFALAAALYSWCPPRR